MKRQVLAAIALVALIGIGLAAWLLTRDVRDVDAPQRPEEMNAPRAESAPEEAAPATRDSETPVDPDITVLLETAAAQVNAEAPIRIDEVTTLTRATTRANRIRYRYEVSGTISADRIAANRESMAAATRRDVCRNAQDREIIDAGAQIEFAYYGPGDAYYFSTEVRGC